MATLLLGCPSFPGCARTDSDGAGIPHDEDCAPDDRTLPGDRDCDGTENGPNALGCVDGYDDTDCDGLTFDAAGTSQLQIVDSDITDNRGIGIAYVAACLP